MTDTQYSIEIFGDVLCSKMHKKSELDTDLQYLLDFAIAAQEMRNRPWGILSDMRDWQANKTALKNKKVYETFDRRNQIAECWIVRDDEQAAALIPSITQNSAIKFIRVRTLEEAIAWYKKQPLVFDHASLQRRYDKTHMNK